MCINLLLVLYISVYELIRVLCTDRNESGGEGGGEERYKCHPQCHSKWSNHLNSSNSRMTT